MKTIQLSVPFAHTAEKVWASLVDPAEREQWFGGSYAIEPREGGAVRIDLADDDLHGSGVVRRFGPPHVLEHTFVDDRAPDVETVCTWGVTRTVDGALLTLHHAGPRRDTWSRALRTPILRRARRVLLVSFIGEEVPGTLLRAGFEVLAKTGPGPDQWAVGRLDGPIVQWDARAEPMPVDLVHLDVASLFDEYLDVAVALGASTYWVHYSEDGPPPEDVSAEWRAKTEARGLTYVDDVYIADAARRLASGGVS